MTREQLEQVKVPFPVRSVYDGHKATVTGFAQDYPSGDPFSASIIGGSPIARFKGGGWLLLSDLLRNFELAARDESS